MTERRSLSVRPSPAGEAGADVELPGPGVGDWVWPSWLRRQLDPSSPAWQPADLAGRNRTGRNWTVIGLPDGIDRWLVDPCGLLAPSSGRWALDWWVGSDDRWRLPSEEASVRQRLVEAAPVVETVMRVPGGEVVARHWAVPGDDADVMMVEIDNAGTAAVAVALALRPVGPAGRAPMGRISVEGGRVTVDGATVLHAGVAPRQSVVSGAAQGDVAVTVLANAAPTARDATVACPDRWAGAALVWPLAQRAVLRVELPGTARRQRHGPALRRAPASAGRRVPAAAGRAGPAAAARGWSARATRLTRLTLPAGPFASALEAQRRHLLLAAPVGEGIDHDRPGSALVVAALCTAGMRAEATPHLGAWLDDQHRNGLLGRDAVDTASTLWALGTWSRTGDDDGLVARSPLAVARAAEAVARREPTGSPTAAVWAVAGLQAASALLVRLGEHDGAAQAGEWARSRAAALLRGLASPPGPAAVGGLPATEGARSAPGDEVDAPGEAALLGVVVGAVPPRHPVARTALLAARRPVRGIPAGAIAGPSPSLGLRPELGLIFATAAVLAGDDPAEALRWILSAASATWTWPTVVSPRLGTGSHGSGHDPRVAAALWSYGRALLVNDLDGEGDARSAGGCARLDLLGVVPVDWIGQGVEVHGLPTAAGSLSYALRWHGRRPAVLWEIDGSGAPPALRAPGLDPAWRGAGWCGEALLEAVPLLEGAAVPPRRPVEDDQGADGPSLA